MAGREQVVGEQRTDLVAAEHPPAVGVRNGGGAAVGVRVVGDHQVDPAPAASAVARSIAPGSSGLGKATVGKSGSGCSCCSTTYGASKPAVSSTWTTEVPPTPCSGV